MSTVAVIGAGAAGVVAALNASVKHDVILLDGNDKCGKKILLTGNGRCNYWNSDMGAHKYDTDCMDNLENIMSDMNCSEVLSWLDRTGVYPRIRDGYYYPYSNQASSFREIFQNLIDKSNVEFLCGFKVSGIDKENDKFVIFSEDGRKVTCDKVIIATGSKAAPKTGSDGSGYDLAQSLGHKVNPVYPALTPLISTGKFLKEWEKIRSDATVTLSVDGKTVKEDTGEIQLTSSGISGICTFNISGCAAKSVAEGRNVKVYINFMPYLEDGFYNWFSTRCSVLVNPTLETALESIFNYKLMFVLLKKAGVSKGDFWFNISEDKKRTLCKVIESFPLDIVGAESFDKAQVCTGGVSLSEINCNTMESLICKGLYFAGEVLDVDGRCGGYNLAFAFVSGYIAGRSV